MKKESVWERRKNHIRKNNPEKIGKGIKKHIKEYNNASWNFLEKNKEKWRKERTVCELEGWPCTRESKTEFDRGYRDHFQRSQSLDYYWGFTAWKERAMAFMRHKKCSTEDRAASKLIFDWISSLFFSGLFFYLLHSSFFSMDISFSSGITTLTIRKKSPRKL